MGWMRWTCGCIRVGNTDHKTKSIIDKFYVCNSNVKLKEWYNTQIDKEQIPSVQIKLNSSFKSFLKEEQLKKGELPKSCLINSKLDPEESLIKSSKSKRDLKICGPSAPVKQVLLSEGKDKRTIRVLSDTKSQQEIFAMRKLDLNDTCKSGYQNPTVETKLICKAYRQLAKNRSSITEACSDRQGTAPYSTIAFSTAVSGIIGENDAALPNTSSKNKKHELLEGTEIKPANLSTSEQKKCDVSSDNRERVSTPIPDELLRNMECLVLMNDQYHVLQAIELLRSGVAHHAQTLEPCITEFVQLLIACIQSTDTRVADEAILAVLDLLRIYRNKMLHTLVSPSAIPKRSSQNWYNLSKYDEGLVIQLLLYAHNERNPKATRLAAEKALRFIATNLDQRTAIRIFESIVFGNDIKILKKKASEYLTFATYRLL